MIWVILIVGLLAFFVKEYINDFVKINPKLIKWSKVVVPITWMGLYCINYEILGENIMVWALFATIGIIACYWTLKIASFAVDVLLGNV